MNHLQDARLYPAALMKALINITDVRILQYTLTLLEDFVAYDTANRAKFIVRPGSTDGKVYYTPMLQLVGTSGSGARIASIDANPYVLERAAACVSYLLGVDNSDFASTSSMFAWVLTHLRSYGSTNPKQVKVTEVAVTALMILLRSDFFRNLFVEERGVEKLVPMLNARNTQLLYEVVFCLWSLSLSQVYAPVLERAGAVTGASRLARVGMPLKILRVSFAMLVVCTHH
jgi:hypothetical protein